MLPRFAVVSEHDHHGGSGWALFDRDEQRISGGWFADRVAAERTAETLNAAPEGKIKMTACIQSDHAAPQRRRCRNCRREFTVQSVRSRKRYCSDACRKRLKHWADLLYGQPAVKIAIQP